MSESVNRPFLPGKEVFSNNHLANGLERTSSEMKGGINLYFCSCLSSECWLYELFYFKEKLEMEDTENGEKSLSRREFLAGTAAVLAGGSLLAACGSTTSTGGSTSTPGATSTNYTFVLIQGVKGDPFYVTMQKGAQEMADKLGVKLLVDGPAQFSATLQAPIVNAYIAKKVDVMIIAACDKQAMIAPMQNANNAGIKVISVDTFIGNGDYTNGPVTFPLSYISSDNVQGGKIAAEALIKPSDNQCSNYIEQVIHGYRNTVLRI